MKVTEPTSSEPESPRPVRIVAYDGASLEGRVYAPSGGATRATVVIHGATAVPQRFYAPFSRYLARHGLRVVTYDYRGIGASREPEGAPATMRDWGERDAAAGFALARSLAAGGPVVGVGHSFGGQTLGLCEPWRAADAAVLVGSQLGYWGHFPAPARWRFALMWYGVVPAATAAFGRLPGWMGLGTDLPKGVARQWARWCRDPEYLLSEEPAARARFGRHRAPTLMLSFTDDEYAPEAAVRALSDLLPAGLVEHARISPARAGAPIGHFGFFRPSAERELWGPTLVWLDEVLRRPRQHPSEPAAAPAWPGGPT